MRGVIFSFSKTQFKQEAIALFQKKNLNREVEDIEFPTRVAPLNK